MQKLLITAALVILASAAAGVGYMLAEQKITNSIYRDRLQEIAGEYDSLRDRYNEAVRRTAVTELIVKNQKLSIRVSTAEGTVRTVDLPYDPANEIHCDYLVSGGRLWIRRIYDEFTAPSQGTVINPDISNVDWSSPSVKQGNTVYRALTDGRWLVTVTGEGSLGLAKVDDEVEHRLIDRPPVRDYEQIEREINAEVERIGIGDVLGQLW